MEIFGHEVNFEIEILTPIIQYSYLTCLTEVKWIL